MSQNDNFGKKRLCYIELKKLIEVSWAEFKIEELLDKPRKTKG
jgi:hypothetical protein